MANKIFTISELRPLMVSYRLGYGIRVGATCGCFDLLHVGHIRFLKSARERCERLVVCVNSDASVRRLKGNVRPLVPISERMEMLAALEAVDYVVSFSDDRPDPMIDVIQPSFWFKGGDYILNDVAERAIVESYGGQVVFVPYWKDRSTTALYEALKSSMKGGPKC